MKTRFSLRIFFASLAVALAASLIAFPVPMGILSPVFEREVRDVRGVRPSSKVRLRSPASSVTVDRYKRNINDSLEWIDRFNKWQQYEQQQNCKRCSSIYYSDPEAPPSTPCDRFYDDLYNNTHDPSVLAMNFTFGYLENESSSTVSDSYMAQALIENVTAECGIENVSPVCGFRQDVNDGTVFTKEVQLPNGNIKTLRLTIVHSSVSGFDKKNRGELRELQQAQSRRAEEAFLDSLGSSDFPVYAGHWRAGGGPSTFPPDLKNNRVDLKKYKREQVSYHTMLRTLERSPKKPKILGLYACNTEKLAREDLLRVAPNTATILTGGTKVYPASHLRHLLTTLDSVLRRRCDPAFNEVLVDQFETEDRPGGVSPVKMTNGIERFESPTTNFSPPAVNDRDPYGAFPDDNPSVAPYTNRNRNSEGSESPYEDGGDFGHRESSY